MRLDFHGTPLILHADRAVEVPNKNALIIADTHFGKSATFRASGLPVPEGDTATDLARLDALLATTKVEQLIIAGDFMHASEAKSTAVLDLLDQWFAKLAIKLVLIQGNHDQRVGKLPSKWGHTWVSNHQLDALHITHDPKDAKPNTPTLAGHLHPVVAVKQSKGRRLRLPCFWQRQQQLTLPAFGSFTGGHALDPQSDEQVYSIVADQVIHLPKERYS